MGFHTTNGLPTPAPPDPTQYKRWASGTATVSLSTLTVTGLPFSPSFVIAKQTTTSSSHYMVAVYGNKNTMGTVSDASLFTNISGTTSIGTPTINPDGFSIPAYNGTYFWIAFE